jgi:glycosyltransferase involved in cell wall biosynthesis
MITSQPIEELVSIVMPIYNHASIAGDAVKSILAQTYKNFELIIVNDGSTDGLEKVLETYQKDERVRIINQPNQKLPSALNTGFNNAKGEFYTWVSADNITHKNWLETLIDALKIYPSAGLVYSDYELIDETGKSLSDSNFRASNRIGENPRCFLPPIVEIQNFHLSGNNFLGASFLWRKETHHIVGVHNENLFGLEDYDFWLRFNLVSPIIHIDKNLYSYRVHKNTLNSSLNSHEVSKLRFKTLFEDSVRRALLLTDPLKILHPKKGGDFLRDISQYRLNISQQIRPIQYSSMADVKRLTLDSNLIYVLDMGASIENFDLDVFRYVDIVVCSDEGIRQKIIDKGAPLGKRVLVIGDENSNNIIHASALRIAEKLMEKSGPGLIHHPGIY